MKRRHFERGSSMVEFALVSAALLLLVFGILEFGRAIYTYHTVTNAARIGSRWAIVRGTKSCSGNTGQALANNPAYGTCPASSDEIQKYVRSQVPLADSSTLNVTATFPGTGCSNPADHQSAGCVVQVQASDAFNFAVPFVSATTMNISSTSEMVISQ